ncbi:S8 family peptidase [Streptomyces beijiangensis]|uniref:S8 family serine peptidase n=1 Tax=Streptomyces beijiangensis TaxID=163361 RepID=A0A939F434_9ACTN|nr:S8 family serine peptidase [Streptomyces beijiangensis]MBO0511049.1 S8 family serine peptidase [Streptomyces beijiangensis]
MQHPPRGRTRSGLLATAVVVALGASLTSVAGAQATQAPTGLVDSAQRTASTATITLVTGDTVTVNTAPDGRQSVDANPAAGSAKTFRTVSGPDGDLYVYPSDVLDGVASGALDARLFNVTQLIKDGYADSKSDEFPVIVSYGDKPNAATLTKRADALPDSDRGAVLDRLDMAGVQVGKKNAKSFWQQVKPVSKVPRNGKAVTAPGSAGVTKVWYDGKAKVSLDQSVPQIGAPEAWAKGYDGKGSKVAILDTGVDLTNADVKDRVTESQSFVPGVPVTDGHGHGTHVASTIAGSGANSGGKYKGVAPEADLLIGKVLGNTGSGEYSWIMAGMEWAVGEGADVVSMSLGGPATPGGDAMTQAVDRLSASSSTLFVIAAGNAGPGASSIGSPGTADSALTVGAVDKSDVLASFSSRGPRLGDNAIKPEITAPGVNIVAARAAGTTMGTPTGEFYTSASGTSMATPHVAGAAAILAQRHPDWTGQHIKEALTTHAKIAPNSSVYEQGDGRVDIPAALDPELEISGSSDFGLVEWSDTGYEKETRKVTLTNPTATAATVALSATAGDALPAGALSLSDGSVTVPAGGTADVTLTLDPSDVATGEYSGYLTATTAEGKSAHTAIGFSKEAERRGLTLDFKDRLGNAPGGASFTVLGLDNNYFAQFSAAGGHQELRLPVGKYSVSGLLVTSASGNATVDHSTDLFSVPEIDLTTKDAAETVDGTTATNFDMRLPDETRALEDSQLSYQLTRYTENRARRATYGIAGLSNWSQEQFGAIPAAKPATGELLSSFWQSKREPLIRATVTRPETFALAAKTSSYLKRFSGTYKYDVVDAGSGSAADLAAVDVKGKAALIHFDTLKSSQIRAVEAAGAEAVVLAPNSKAPHSIVVLGVNVPYFSTTYADGRALAAAVAQGRTSLSLKGVEESGYQYSGQWDFSGIPANLRTTARAKDFATIKNSFHTDGAARMGYATIHSWGSYPMTSLRSGQFVQQGETRDDYVRAGNSLTYEQNIWARTDYATAMVESAKGYLPGAVSTEDWWAPAMHPANVTPYACNFCRTDAGTVFAPQLGGDSDADHFSKTGRSRVYTYYRDGQKITDTTKLMVPEKASYRFVDDTARLADYPGVNLGTKTHTEYSFSSAAPTAMSVKDCKVSVPKATLCEALPVVLLDYGMKADITNRVAADKAFSFTVDASRSKASTASTTMAGAKVSVSYDDGATWQPVAVSRKDANSFKATVQHPELSATNGFVSLRTEVWDSEGNRTSQDITRAYALK